jgi:hypothetical protein
LPRGVREDGTTARANEHGGIVAQSRTVIPARPEPARDA